MHAGEGHHESDRGVQRSPLLHPAAKCQRTSLHSLPARLKAHFPPTQPFLHSLSQLSFFLQSILTSLPIIHPSFILPPSGTHSQSHLFHQSPLTTYSPGTRHHQHHINTSSLQQEQQQLHPEEISAKPQARGSGYIRHFFIAPARQARFGSA